MVFDVFLCHNSHDKDAVKEIGERLKAAGLKPWLDEWELQPGRRWIPEIEKQIGSIRSAAAFVGENGIGPWQDEEVDAILRAFQADGRSVVPVALATCSEEPPLPLFLAGRTWVDFRKQDPNPFDQLLWGITGLRPGPTKKSVALPLNSLPFGSLGDPLPVSARKQVAASAGLFVGVREFEDRSLPMVPFAVDDAVDLAHLFVLELGLLDPTKTMLLLSGEPQKEESRQRLAELLAAKVESEPARKRSVYHHLHRLGRETRKEGLFVTSFAAHGVIDRGNGILALADALKIKLEQTGLVLEDVLEDLHRFVSAGRRLVLVDACREYYEEKRGGGSPASILGDAFVAAMENARGCAVLAGAAHGGYAYDDHERRNGVFTAALLDGLRGEAEGDDKALITLESLADFTHLRVRTWIEKHRNPPEDAVLGILATYDPAEMRGLPLAIHAQKLIDAFAQRRRKAMAHLAGLVDTRDVLFKDVERRLDIDFPRAWHFELLIEVEAFDGTPRLRRALVGFLKETENIVFLRLDEILDL